MFGSYRDRLGNLCGTSVSASLDIARSRRAEKIRNGEATPTERETREIKRRASKSRMTWGDGRP